MTTQLQARALHIRHLCEVPVGHADADMRILETIGFTLFHGEGHMYGWDDLALDIEYRHARTERDRRTSVSIDALLLINGERMPDSMQIHAFFEALTIRGFRTESIPLFTCSGCGTFGCGGYSMDVRCTDEAWILRNRYYPDSRQVIEAVEYWFAWVQVKAVATQLLNALERVKRCWPQAALYSDPDSWDLSPYLPQYATWTAALPLVTPARW